MASILKNQVLKHLSKFTKNLSPDQLHLSTFKGVGDLRDLELNEKVLMELIELPTWLNVTRATCNRVSVKIQWTKLKSQPICLYLDEVFVDIETCDEPRCGATGGALDHNYSSYAGASKYGFSEKVIDGMYVLVNNVTVNFTSHAFRASIQMQKIKVQSTKPNWQPCTDLKWTRVRSPDHNDIIIFKELEWQLLRFEANALAPHESGLPRSPVRLIMNKSRLRVAVKKRVSDCGVLNTCWHLVLDDLLWVLTDAQLKATLLCGKSLTNIIHKSSDMSKSKANAHNTQTDRKMPAASSDGLLSVSAGVKGSGATLDRMSQAYQAYRKCDVVETSYHLSIGRFDVHLCEEDFSQISSSLHSSEVNGGALQLLFIKFCVDAYPYHAADKDREHWIHKDSSTDGGYLWCKELLKAFTDNVKVYLGLDLSFEEQMSKLNKQRASSFAGSATSAPGKGSKPCQATDVVNRLMTSCYLLHMEEFIVYSVTANNRKVEHSSEGSKLVCSDKGRLYLPKHMCALRLEFTEYYFPNDHSLPVPPPSIYIHMNPIKVYVDYLSLLWLNTFQESVRYSYGEMERATEEPLHVDIRLQAILPRVIIPMDVKNPGELVEHIERPTAVQLQLSELVLTNCFSVNADRTNELTNTVNEIRNGCVHLPTDGSSTYQYAWGMDPLNYKLLLHSNQFVHAFKLFERLQTQQNSDPVASAMDLCSNSFHLPAFIDIWHVCAHQLWLDYIGVPHAKGRPVTFTDAFNVNLYVSLPELDGGPFCAADTADIPRCEHTTDIHGRSKSERGLGLHLEDHHDHCDLKHGHKSLGCVAADVNEALGTDTVATFTSLIRREAESELEKWRVDVGRSRQGQGAPGACSLECNHIHAVVDISSNISAYINHYQYLTLLRINECVSRLQEQIAQDRTAIITKYTSISGATNTPPSLAIAATTTVLPKLELVVTTPAGSSLFSRSLDTIDDQLDSGRSSKLGGAASDQPPNAATELAMLHQQTEVISMPLSNHVSSLANDLKGKLSSNASITPGMPPAAPAGNGKTLTALAPEILVDYASVSEEHNGIQHEDEWEREISAFQAIVVDTPAGKSQQSATGKLMSNFSKLGRMMGAPSDDGASDGGYSVEDYDTQSIQSDLSDQILLQGMLGSDSLLPEDSALEADESSVGAGSSSIGIARDESVDTMSSARKAEMVSVLCINLLSSHGSYVLSDAGSTVCRLRTPKVHLLELGSMSFEEYANKFSLRDKSGHQELMQDAGTRQCESEGELTLSLYLGHIAGEYDRKGEQLGFLHIYAKDFDVNLRMSSINNLLALIEDEKRGVPMPMVVNATNINLSLEEDRPPLYPSPLSESAPLELCIPNTTVKMYHTGVIKIIPSGQTVNDNNNPQQPQQPGTLLCRCLDASPPTSHKATQHNTTAPDEELVARIQQLETQTAILKSQLCEVRTELTVCKQTLQKRDNELKLCDNEKESLRMTVQILKSDLENNS